MSGRRNLLRLSWDFEARDWNSRLPVMGEPFYGYAKQKVVVEIATFYSFEEQWWTRKRDDRPRKSRRVIASFAVWPRVALCELIPGV